MKFRYFILIGFILVLLSLTAVSADENVTVEDDTVDLSVDVEGKDTYDGDEYNREGYTVSWIVGVNNRLQHHGPGFIIRESGDRRLLSDKRII